MTNNTTINQNLERARGGTLKRAREIERGGTFKVREEVLLEREKQMS